MNNFQLSSMASLYIQMDINDAIESALKLIASGHLQAEELEKLQDEYEDIQRKMGEPGWLNDFLQ